jgi:ribulose-5-phosphate 4-epimerase/fuculose-1-phosphate aldolase
MRYAFVPEDIDSPWHQAMEAGIARAMERHGHVRIDDPQAANLVFHRVRPQAPRPFRRRARATFVVGVAEGPTPDDVLRATYPVLVRSLSNLLVYGHPGPDGVPVAHMVTPELGCYEAARATTADGDTFFEAVYDRIAPLATSHLVIDNMFDEDLEPELAQGTQVTRELAEAARTLDRWALFPAPYPVAEMLGPDDYRHLRHVFGIGGLSYGNLSARHDRHRFWMSASGVDKGKVGQVGRDILLVKGYDPEADAMRISVPPGASPLRVSVDAVEHWQVYERHPEIGAMIHIHAWVDGVATTEVNYPCGTVEMGKAMADLFDRDPHPERTVIGLRNHGITATGPSFPDILARLENRVRTQVPMT